MTSIGAVFFERMLIENVLLKIVAVAFFQKKLHPKGVWGNGRLPQLNLPSALAVAEQVYSFLFAYRDVLIAFNVGLVLHCFCWKFIGLFNRIFAW